MTQAEEICWESQPAIEKKARQGSPGCHVTCNLTSPSPAPVLGSREQLSAADGKHCSPPALQSHCAVN